MKLPTLSGKEMLKLLELIGFKTVRQRGSHVSLHKTIDGKTFLVVVPLKREIKKGTLLSILRQAGLKREDFLKLIKK